MSTPSIKSEDSLSQHIRVEMEEQEPSQALAKPVVKKTLETILAELENAEIMKKAQGILPNLSKKEIKLFKTVKHNYRKTVEKGTKTLSPKLEEIVESVRSDIPQSLRYTLALDQPNRDFTEDDETLQKVRTVLAAISTENLRRLNQNPNLSDEELIQTPKRLFGVEIPTVRFNTKLDIEPQKLTDTDSGFSSPEEATSRGGKTT